MGFLVVFVLFWAASASIVVNHFFHLLWATILSFLLAGVIAYLIGNKIVWFFCEYPFWDRCLEKQAEVDMKELLKEEEDYFFVFGADNVTLWIPRTQKDLEANPRIKVTKIEGDKNTLTLTSLPPANPILKFFFYPFFPSHMEYKLTEEIYNKLFNSKEETNNE